MKSLSEFLNESIIEEGIIDKCKALTKAAYKKILRKINDLENPCIMVDVGLHDLYLYTDQRELENVEYAVFDIKTVIDKLNKYILDNVKSAKEITNFGKADEDTHLYELVGMSTDDAIKLYNTVSDMFVKEMKKIGIETLKDRSGVRGEGLKKFNHLEVDAEFKMERTLDTEYDRRPSCVYIYPAVRLEYI